MSAEEAKERLLLALPHIKLAIGMAEVESGNESTVKLAICVYSKDGKGGRIACSFDYKDFMGDLADIVGVKQEPFWMKPEPDDDKP